VRNIIVAMIMATLLWGCAGIPKKADKKPVDGCKFLDSGLASWYGNEMAIGKRGGEYIFNPTASGEKFVPSAMTAAHPKLPFGAIIKVVLDKPGANPHGVNVRINDRGPFVHSRIIDLSSGSARALGMPNTQPVRIYRCS
jgi:rare lipoprotein A